MAAITGKALFETLSLFPEDTRGTIIKTLSLDEMRAIILDQLQRRNHDSAAAVIICELVLHDIPRH